MASRAPETYEQELAPREWFSASELAALALPGLGADRRAINRMAQEQRWTSRTGADGALLVRPRAGKGGGVEFHASLLPAATRLELAKRGLIGARPAPVAVDPDIGGWRWYEAQSAAVRAEAEARLAIVREIELLREGGMTGTAAIADVSARRGKSNATLWNWIGLLDGVPAHNRLPALAPRRKGGGREAEIDPILWTLYKSDVLRPEAATLTSCYDRVAAKAEEMGLSLPCERTFRRRAEREIDPAIWKLLREGEEALRRSIPAQRRTVGHLNAMEVVNIDGHKFDVMVTPPEGGDPIRPIMVMIQDVRSSKVVGWRLGKTESAELARLAVADMIRDYGIPKRMTSDNGRAFASKLFSGGQDNRFRFKKFDNEPTGLMTALGVDINWAIPGRGQSKPIERAFRDLADRVSRAPECHGAYVGPNPMKKPANYGQRAMGWEAFRAHVERCIIRHNAKLGRRGRDYNGRSFDQVFAETLTDVGKASPEHLRMALLAADQVRVNAQTGEVALFGNRYWADGIERLRGKLVMVRYDPDNLHSPIHLYDGGTFLLTAELVVDTGWGTREGAKAAGKRWSGYRRRIRDAAEAEQLLAAEELAALQAGAEPIELPEPTVIRPVRHRGQTAAQLKPAPMPQATIAAERESRIFGALHLVRGDD